MKRKIKILVDVLMFLLFLYLLSYRPGMGLMYHAVIGIAQLTLFILHHLLNLNWYRTLFRGKYRFRRILLTGSDFLLLIAMAFMILSSVMISGMIFDFVGIRMIGWWRRIHVASSGWCFLLSAFHVGMHMQGLLNKLQKKLQKVPWLYRIIQSLLVAVGVYCFTLSDLWPRTTLARRLPLLTYTGEEMFGIYLAVVIGVTVLVSWILALDKHLKKNQL
jgi:hypothetical protein